MPPDSPFERIAITVKRQLAAVGVELLPEEVPVDELSKRAGAGQYEALLIEVISGQTMFRPYVVWHSQGPSNWGKFGTSTSDGALDRVRRAQSDDEYRDAVAGLQQNFMDDPPAVFLAWSGARPRRQPAVRRAGGRAWPGRPEHHPPLETATGGPAREPKLTSMAFKVRHIATRFALLLGVAAIVPLLAYGFVSIWSLQRGTRDSIVAGNQNVATRAAEEIRRYVVTNAALLKALSADLQDTGLDQSNRIRFSRTTSSASANSRDHTLRRSGAVVATSRIGKPHVSIPRAAARHRRRLDVADPRRRRPAADVGVRHPPHRLNKPSGWLVGSSASKRCGGWSIRSASATTASRSSSRPTAS
jgi:hypothetical protein